MHVFADPLRFRIIAVLAVLLLVVAACQPQATPTPTPEPEPSPTVEEVVEEEPAETEAAEETEEVEPTEEGAAEDLATEEATAEDQATEEAGAGETEEAEAEGTAEAASGEGVHAVVGVTSTRVRAEPSVRGDVVAELAEGDELTVLGETANAGYVLVRTANGEEGWVSKQTVRFDNPFVDLPIVEP